MREKIIMITNFRILIASFQEIWQFPLQVIATFFFIWKISPDNLQNEIIFHSQISIVSELTLNSRIQKSFHDLGTLFFSALFHLSSTHKNSLFEIKLNMKWRNFCHLIAESHACGWKSFNALSSSGKQWIADCETYAAIACAFFVSTRQCKLKWILYPSENDVKLGK